MTRRKLSDVLRQEVQKDTVSEPDQSQSAASASQPRTGSRTRKEGVDAPPVDASALGASAQVEELKAALAQGAEQTKALQAQLKTLQADVKGKQKQIETLEAQTTQVEQLKAELAEAKDYILQLSEANTQMSLTLDSLKQPKAQSQPKAQTKTPPKTPQRATPLALRPLPYHSVQHEPSPAKANSKSVDVGWMD